MPDASAPTVTALFPRQRPPDALSLSTPKLPDDPVKALNHAILGNDPEAIFDIVYALGDRNQCALEICTSTLAGIFNPLSDKIRRGALDYTNYILIRDIFFRAADASPNPTDIKTSIAIAEEKHGITILQSALPHQKLKLSFIFLAAAKDLLNNPRPKVSEAHLIKSGQIIDMNQLTLEDLKRLDITPNILILHLKNLCNDVIPTALSGNASNENGEAMQNSSWVGLYLERVKTKLKRMREPA